LARFVVVAVVVMTGCTAVDCVAVAAVWLAGVVELLLDPPQAPSPVAAPASKSASDLRVTTAARKSS
jgi:hypothetical protein